MTASSFKNLPFLKMKTAEDGVILQRYNIQYIIASFMETTNKSIYFFFFLTS